MRSSSKMSTQGRGERIKPLRLPTMRGSVEGNREKETKVVIF